MYDPQRPTGTLQRVPASYPPYYYTDRVSYASPTGTGRYEKSAVTVDVEHYRPGFGPCMWILAILSILLIIILVVCLILFFTWGSGYRGGEKGIVAHDKPTYLLPLEQPELILNSLKTGDRQFCILDTSYLNPNYGQLYTQEHIPTAKHFDINKVLKNKNVEDSSNVTPLVSILEFQNYVRSLGIGKDCHVVIYDHGESNDSIVTATYVWYLFRLHQHNKATIINGGLKAWRELTKKEPQYQATNVISKTGKEGDFQAGWNPNLWLSFEDLKSSLGKKDSPQVFDARNPDYYKGTAKNKDAKQGGRVKGAINTPVEQVIKPDTGGFKILPQIKDWMKEKKMNLDGPTVIYSDYGLHASALYFLVAQTGAKQDIKMYNNGWNEWSYKAPEDFKESD